MQNVFFLHQIYHNKANGTWNKGIVIKDDPEKDNWDGARQSYYAYLGAYGFGNNADIDFVQCEISDSAGNRLLWENWEAPIPEPEPEPEVEPEIEPEGE